MHRAPGTQLVYTPNSAEQRFLCSDGVQASADASGSVGSPNQGHQSIDDAFLSLLLPSIYS